MALNIKIELDINTEEFVTRLYAHSVQLEAVAGAYAKALQAIVDQAEVHGFWNEEHQLAKEALDAMKANAETNPAEVRNEAVTNPNAFYGKLVDGSNYSEFVRDRELGAEILKRALKVLFEKRNEAKNKSIYEKVDEMLKAGGKVVFQDSGSIFIEPKEERVDEIREK